MNTVNPYAPPKAAVSDIADPHAPVERAGRGTRLAAAVLDGIIAVAVTYLPLFLTGALKLDGTTPDFSALMGVGGAIALVGFIAWIGVTWYLVKRNGQTIGKKLLGIRVVRSSGSPASVARIFWLRNIVNGIPGAIPVLGILYVLVDHLLIFGEPRQCLHDRIADTTVVNA
jgi:uncharacterized RDD family membrane protein YckC